MKPLKSTLFIHMSDTHIFSPDSGKNLFQLNTGEKLERLLNTITSLASKPDFCVISGDLTQDGDESDYLFLKQIIKRAEERLGIPFFLAMGNHDFRETFRTVFLEEEGTNDNYYYVKDVQGLRLIVLDSKLDGKIEGELSQEQLDWLSLLLQEKAEKGTIIVVHHPPMTSNLRNWEAFADVVKNTDVIGILSGHTHNNISFLLDTIPVFVSGGVAFGIDPLSTDPLQIVDTSGFNLVNVYAKKITVYQMAAEQKEVTKLYAQNSIHN